MIANGDFTLVDGDNGVEISYQVGQELEQTIDDAIRCAATHLHNHLKEYFQNRVLEYKDNFLIRLGADPPVDIRQMEINFEARVALSTCGSASSLQKSWNL